MAPDGKTFYSASFSTGTIVALDITNLSLPVPVWFGNYESHGLSLSDDGTRAYVAKDANAGTLGLTSSTPRRCRSASRTRRSPRSRS